MVGGRRWSVRSSRNPRIPLPVLTCPGDAGSRAETTKFLYFFSHALRSLAVRLGMFLFLPDTNSHNFGGTVASNWPNLIRGGPIQVWIVPITAETAHFLDLPPCFRGQAGRAYRLLLLYSYITWYLHVQDDVGRAVPELSIRAPHFLPDLCVSLFVFSPIRVIDEDPVCGRSWSLLWPWAWNPAERMLELVPRNDNGRGSELSLIMWSFCSGGVQHASTRPEPGPAILVLSVSSTSFGTP